MSLYAAIVELQQGPDRQRAARALREVLYAVGLRSGAIAAFHADAVQGALLKLLEGVRPSATSDAVVRRFLTLMVKNRQLDLARRASRFVLASEAESPELADPRAADINAQLSGGAAPPPDLDELDDRSRALLRHAFAHALESRAPRYRPALEQSWRELEALMGGSTVQALLEQVHGLTPTSPAWKNAVDRMHKAHERAREALAAATEALIADGKITSEDANLARANLCRLRSRQEGASRASIGERT